jgi:DNA-binding transcriptional ArsR family regulator
MVTSPLKITVQRLKALAHPARVRIAAMLRPGELCVCQMTAVLQLAASTVSAHLAELRRAGCVVERKEGRWVFYALSDEGTALLASLAPDLRSDAKLAADAALVARLRAVGPEKLCRADLDLRKLGIGRNATRAR